jgi:hypothetical protein
MQSRLFLGYGAVLAVLCGLSGSYALAATPFTITAANVTMPSSGNGSTEYTVTGIPAAGTVEIGCLFSGTITTAKIPNCTYGPVELIPVTAGQTLTGTIEFYPFGVAVPAGLHRMPRRSGNFPAAGLALTGALMLGFGWRRRARRWLMLSVIAVGTLAGLAGISACGGNSRAMTPGTYQYTVTAVYAPSPQTPLEDLTTTTINVTVP